MQLAFAQLQNHLAKGLRSLYTLHGDEPLQQQEAADAIRAVARAQGYTERSSYTVAGAHFDWSEVLAAGGSLSLFAERQIVEVRIPSGKPGKEGSPAIQQLAQAAVGNDSTLTIFILPRLDKATRTGAWFTALEQQGVTIALEPVERQALPAWIAQRLQQQGQRVAAGEEGQRTLQFFADRVEGNLLAAHQEIQKLALLYPAGKLSFEQVHEAVLNVARYDVFKLNEAMLSGDCARLVRMMDGLKGEGEALPLVLWAVAEEVRTLLKLKSAMTQGKQLAALLKEYRIWGAREKLMEPALRRISLPTLQSALREAAQIDKMVKGLRAKAFSGDAWDALLQLGLKLARGV